MVKPARGVRKPLRLIQAPLTDDHPDWLELDREIPKDHLARRIRSLVDLLDLSVLLASFAGVGSPAYPPDLMLQMALFHRQRQEHSPAVWFRNSTESLPVRWLLRGLRPSRAVFYRFDDHLPLELVDALNTQVLAIAQDEGHTRAKAGALDGTFHAAAASRHHLLNSTALDQRCAELDAALAQDQGQGASQALDCAPPALPPAAPPPAQPPSQPALAGSAGASAADTPAPGPAAALPAQTGQAATAASRASAAPGANTATPAKRPGWLARTRRGRKRQRQRYEQARQTLAGRLVDHDKKQKRQRKVKRRTAQQVKIAPNEPEAVLGRDKMKVFRPLYNTQILQDLDSPFVLGYGVFASVTDAGLLPPMLERTRELTGRKLEELLVDGIYARLVDVRYCVDHGVQMYAPLPLPSQAVPQANKDKETGKSQGKGKEKLLGKEAFVWLEGEQTYRCPQGHLLELERRCREDRREGEQVLVAQYRCAAEHCGGCPLASRCTKRPDKGRTIKRMEGQELLDAVAQRTQTPVGKERYKKRGRTVELRHADFKVHRGLQRFRRYGLRRAQSLIALLVLVHNGLALRDARDANKAKLAEANSPP